MLDPLDLRGLKRACAHERARRIALGESGEARAVAGLSTVVPLTPGGAGTQQVMLAYALHQTVAAAAAVSFSVGMPAGITVVNALLGLAAAMVAFRTLRPLAAVRSGLGLLRARDTA